jgi:hypothetical protein
MGKLLKKIGVFFLLLFVILILMNYWMDQEEPNPHCPLQYEEVFHPKVKADLVILGASQATHGINPRYLESERMKVFNFALDGAPPSFYLKWYEKIFSRYYRKPSYAIYAVHWVMFDDIVAPRQIEHDSRYFPFRVFIEQLKNRDSLRTLLFNRFAFSKLRKKVFYLLLNRKHERYPRDKYYNGFIPFKERAKFRKPEGGYPRVNPVQLKAFLQLLDDLEKDGIKVIFVHIPGYLYGREARYISKNVQLLKEIAEKKGIPFLDYETERITSINTNPELFSDWTHMNEKGSEVFSKLLRQDLEGFLKGI